MRIYGLLAHPVSHSQSPALYEGWFAHAGMENAKFELFDVEPEKLGAFFERMRDRHTEEIVGLAVSIPHKESVISYLDEVDEVAKEIGAVNTISWDGEKLKGWNTDWIGVRESFTEAGVDVAEKRVLVLGAGGGARAVVYALMHAGAQVLVTNRTFDRAEDLASVFRCPLVHWDDRETVEAEIVVNTTSVGLEDLSASPVSVKFWKELRNGGSEIVAFDLVYRPRVTKFLKDALGAGARIITGDRMLFYQGKAQFRIVTGKKF
ncbi:MAG: shikimate dehydrogenase [Patescibacteria group bacterium]